MAEIAVTEESMLSCCGLLQACECADRMRRGDSICRI